MLVGEWDKRSVPAQCRRAGRTSAEERVPAGGGANRDGAVTHSSRFGWAEGASLINNSQVEMELHCLSRAGAHNWDTEGPGDAPQCALTQAARLPSRSNRS